MLCVKKVLVLGVSSGKGVVQGQIHPLKSICSRARVCQTTARFG